MHTHVDAKKRNRSKHTSIDTQHESIKYIISHSYSLDASRALTSLPVETRAATESNVPYDCLQKSQDVGTDTNADIHGRTHADQKIHTHTNTNTHAHTCTYLHTRTQTYTHAHTCIHTYGTHTHAQTHAHTHMHTHTHTHKHTHAHVHTLFLIQ